MAKFTNRAVLTYGGRTVSSNVAVGETVEVLSATKSAVPETYSAGDVIAYVVSVVNSGTAPVTGVTVDDDLGGYEYGGSTLYPLEYIEGSVIAYVNGVLQTAPAVTPGPPLSITGITVPAGGSAQIVYAARATSAAPLGEGGAIENTATVTSDATSPVTAAATVTASGDADLTVTKSVSPAVVSENGNVTYTFLIRNYGAAEAGAADNVSLSDTLDPVLTGLTATLNGTPLTITDQYTYSEETGLFETEGGVVTVPAATFSRDPVSGDWEVTPGSSTLTINGTLS